MPISCCVKHCKSKWTAGCGISFFRFPKKDEQRLQLWIVAVGRGPTWKPTANSKICSLHFSSSDIISDFGYKSKEVRSTAVPSLAVCTDVDEENMPNALEKSAKASEIVSKQVSDQNANSGPMVVEQVIPEQYLTCQMEISSDEIPTTDNLPKEIEALHEKVSRLLRQVKTLKQTLRRRDHKIKNMTELFKTLQKENLIDKHSLMTLKNRFEGSDCELFAQSLPSNQLKNKNRKDCDHQYSHELK
ncbi:PREDICTED: THAP domain-containing protein 3-like [Vollenhovia emeryi]|uniref:THAP domain-containing protein 3-like n=1 Tax=Vollenhovia emeryi TaxID=411798 RepID=UPI0005F48875|nr:PREDICTED: THAP domain-containing protein 3-like [Vollenhovia emeryi]